MLHLTGTGAAGLDRGLVHDDEVRGANRGQLGFIDRLQEPDRLPRQLRKPRAAQPEVGIHEALVLTVQGQVVGELVDEQAREEAHVRPAALDHPRGGCRTAEGAVGPALDERPDVLDHHITAGALGEPEGLLGADDLKLLGGKPFRLGGGKGNDLHGHPVGIEERQRLGPRIGVLGRTVPVVGGHGLRRCQRR